MLNQATVVATIAVKDLGDAREFYGEVLGLEEIDENPGGITYASGDGKVFVLPMDDCIRIRTGERGPEAI